MDDRHQIESARVSLDPAHDPAIAEAGPPTPIHVQLGDALAHVVRIRRETRDTLRAAELRTTLARLTAPPPPARWAEPQLLRLALPRLLRGELLGVARLDPLPTSMFASEGEEDGAPIGTAPPPAEKKPALSWIEIQLLDPGQNARGGERYKVTLPDGSTREGKLNGEGIIRLSDIPSGECEIAFPDLDESSWQT